MRVKQWGIYSPECEFVTFFPYAQKAEAEAFALKLSTVNPTTGKQRRFVVNPVDGYVINGETIVLNTKMGKESKPLQKIEATYKPPTPPVFTPEPCTPEEYRELVGWKEKYERKCKKRKAFVFETH